MQFLHFLSKKFCLAKHGHWSNSPHGKTIQGRFVPAKQRNCRIKFYLLSEYFHSEPNHDFVEINLIGN